MDRETSPPPGIFSMQPEEVQITCFISSHIRRKGQSICRLAKRFSSFLGIFTLNLLLIFNYDQIQNSQPFIHIQTKQEGHASRGEQAMRVQCFGLFPFSGTSRNIAPSSVNKLLYLEVPIKNMFWLILFFSQRGIK